MRLLSLLIAVFLSFAFAANATPPQVVEITETMLGVNDTHLFVLRRLDDNLGYHHTTQTDIVLIARNKQTNRDDQVWPVSRVIDHGVDFAEFNEAVRVQILPLPDRVNPFDILLWRKARPLISPTQSQSHLPSFEVGRTQGNLTITAGYGEKITYRLDDHPVANLITQSLTVTRTAVPAYASQDTPFLYASDILKDVRFDVGKHCKYGDLTNVTDFVSGSFSSYWITQISCEDDDLVQPLTMYLIVPQLN